MNNIVEFAKRMKAQREKMGLTQAQLGKKIGVSAQSRHMKGTYPATKGKRQPLTKQFLYLKHLVFRLTICVERPQRSKRDAI